MVENRLLLNDEKWERIAPLLPGKLTDRGRTAACNHTFIEAILWIARTGCPSRDLPKYFGHWNNVYKRFARWCEKEAYLRLSGCHAGLLINFNVRVLRNGIKRMVHQLPER